MDIVNTNLKVRELFTPLPNGFYEYKGQYSLKILNKEIAIGGYIDLSEFNLLSPYEDTTTTTFHLDLVDEIFHYDSHSSSF